MKLRNFVLLSVSATAFLTGSALNLNDHSVEPPREPAQEVSGAEIITLYAGDETRCSLNMNTGGYGSSVVDGVVNLDQTQLLWNLLDPGKISIGYGRNQAATVVDLGEAYVRPANDPRSNSPLIPTSVFHSLRIDGKNVIHDAPGRRAILSSKGRRLFTMAAQLSPTHFLPTPGHTYMMKFQPGGVGSREVNYLKIHVIDLQPKHSLTIQWQRMVVR